MEVLLNILGFKIKSGKEVRNEVRNEMKKQEIQGDFGDETGDSGEVGATHQMTDPPRDYGFSLGTSAEASGLKGIFMEGVRQASKSKRGLDNLNPAGAAAERRRVSNELTATWEKLLGTAWKRRQSE